MWKLNETFLNNQWGKEKTPREFRKCFEVKEDKNTPKLM